jgi:uncharacterized membrane protein (UPF0127 family)
MRSRPSIPLAALAVGLAAAAPLLANAQSPTLALSVGKHPIQAEVASTFESRARGLMYRKSLPTDRGMLFVFPDVGPQCMWMKNTYVPLSVAFIDERGVILNIADMKPQTEDSHCAAAPARYVLEMNQGWFAAKGIKPGAPIAGIEKAPAPR